MKKNIIMTNAAGSTAVLVDSLISSLDDHQRRVAPNELLSAANCLTVIKKFEIKAKQIELQNPIIVNFLYHTANKKCQFREIPKARHSIKGEYRGEKTKEKPRRLKSPKSPRASADFSRDSPASEKSNFKLLLAHNLSNNISIPHN